MIPFRFISLGLFVFTGRAPIGLVRQCHVVAERDPSYCFIGRH